MVRTKRWNDPIEPHDGTRILVCRYRPRGVRKENESWSEWHPELGPSRELHAEYYGKTGAPLAWSEFRKRYLREVRSQAAAIRSLGERVRRHETITLLCSSACIDASRCHRTLLRELLERAAGDQLGERRLSGPR